MYEVFNTKFLFAQESIFCIFSVMGHPSWNGDATRPSLLIRSCKSSFLSIFWASYEAQITIRQWMNIKYIAKLLRWVDLMELEGHLRLVEWLVLKLIISLIEQRWMT